MATLNIHNVSDKVAQAYFNAPKAQQDRLKRILYFTRPQLELFSPL